jgi:hypothetical protein
LQFSFEITEPVQAKVKDRSGEGRVSFAIMKHFNETLHISATARSDHGNAQRFSARPGQVAIETGTGAIAIHRRE